MTEYIDRDTVLEYLKNEEKYFVETKSEMPVAMAMIGVANDIKKLPAADVAPVVHGCWERGDISYRYPSGIRTCSNCGEIDPFSTGKMNYCPNCGAKMDEV